MNETFPPRVRLRWLLITILLSIINLAGIARTDVAVGTVSDASMLCTTRAATPRIGSRVEALCVARVGIGFATGCAGVAGAALTLRTTGCVCTGAATTGAAGVGAAGAVPGIEILGGVTVFGVGGVPPFGAPETGALVVPA
ncbi:unannotated protein [freshwater metagenome]|uniref:Unannotated protein n=1 Tax=freshwater metagenome TaxID=449393 RepID=A0A6J7AB73_9ZZZZ